jgi:hypothetical protein
MTIFGGGGGGARSEMGIIIEGSNSVIKLQSKVGVL